MKFHCLFEQSGTFKNVFKSYGHTAFDYDILDDYGQTDFKIDLFEQIAHTYGYLTAENIDLEKVKRETSYRLFFDMKPDTDFIMAFFPCTHFCDANELQYRLLIGGKKVDYDKRAAERLIKRNKTRAKYFELWLKFCFICKEKNISTIIENPASSGNKNYLVQFSPIEVAYHEKDRTLFGDYFKKPTNFFSINFDMKEQFQMYFDRNYEHKTIYGDKAGTKDRSEISPIYADNFYKRFLEGKIEGIK